MLAVAADEEHKWTRVRTGENVCLFFVAFVFLVLQLTDWWLDVAYLTFREGNPINVSPAIAFPRAQNILTQDDQLQ